ncbi:MAG: tyrosine-type recombinase/integrase, partial [Desulfovibrionaceae bacterium]|nr:tyrosine-type recombinase/integrase [Desulfovibrionaceae bacterium]
MQKQNTGKTANTGRRRGRPSMPDTSLLGNFITEVYVPFASNRKRSWKLDQRTAHLHIIPYLGHRKLTGIQRKDIEKWLHTLLAKGLAPASCNRILHVLKTVYSHAVAHGLLPEHRSPCRDVPSLREGLPRARFLTAEEAYRLKKVLEASPQPEAKAILLLLLTGGRKQEILQARWEHVCLDRRILTVPLSKSGKPRPIALSTEAVTVILSLPREPGCPWLFPGHAPGRPLRDIYTYWNPLRQKLGLDNVRIHDLRHSFASFLVNAGHSLY